MKGDDMSQGEDEDNVEFSVFARAAIEGTIMFVALLAAVGGLAAIMLWLGPELGMVFILALIWAMLVFAMWVGKRS
jgi:hypothetical protein